MPFSLFPVGLFLSCNYLAGLFLFCCFVMHCIALKTELVAAFFLPGFITEQARNHIAPLNLIKQCQLSATSRDLLSKDSVKHDILQPLLSSQMTKKSEEFLLQNSVTLPLS